jgi:L-alanine-DL-glutamate epimerase-like enolase superfamily enzyme
MDSFTHTAQLANKVQSFGAKVMIGDDSLVGPACSAWQQMAIGAGAVWVEAIEKSGDSDDYLSCVVKKATRKTDDSYFAYQPSPGFGIELDEEQLKRICELYVEV